ncbi:hypothetical protein [Sphingomonas sp. URHD0057]|uniref:hypothetical protein n=1 Tax=Sphingomonas sp. URHD0057 TaxID=1380389 RepID=UPI00048FA64B|nr:hypothetical protein [Sphingomonas sp. URHD0057]
MARETRVAYGIVPHALFDDPLEEACWRLRDDEFLLRGEGQHYFHYRRGEGVTVERGPGVDLSEESLWLNGSVYAAIASINGLQPIHASAVAFNDRVYAFTGPAGSGKSTLIAALGSLGFPMFCDDTLILDLSDPDRILCLPGHKRLKLSEEALRLTDAVREEEVSRTVAKFYATPASGSVEIPLPLAELIFLEDGPQAAIDSICGGDRVIRLQDDHYTARLFEAARQFDIPGKFRHLCWLADQIEMSCFVRPRGRDRFRDTVILAADHLRARGSE